MVKIRHKNNQKSNIPYAYKMYNDSHMNTKDTTRVNKNDYDSTSNIKKLEDAINGIAKLITSNNEHSLDVAQSNNTNVSNDYNNEEDQTPSGKLSFLITVDEEYYLSAKSAYKLLTSIPFIKRATQIEWLVSSLKNPEGYLKDENKNIKKQK